MSGASRNSFTMDQNMRLEDGVTTFTTAGGAGLGQVGGANAIVDLGGATGNAGAYTPCSWVVDVDALEFTTEDETYSIWFQLSDSATMASGVVIKAGLQMGDAANNAADDEVAGRVVLGVDNEYKGNLYRYGAIWALAAGTTAVMTIRSFLSR